MDPITAGLLMGGVQTGIGLLQRGAANRRRRKALAGMHYDIPSATTEAVKLAQLRATRNEIPGADRILSRAESEMAGTLAKGESVADTASDVLGLYAKMYGQKLGLQKELGIKGAEYKSANELEMMRSLGLMAEAQNQQFYYNRFVPFLSEMGYAGEQAAGGSANIASGLQTAYSGWMNQWMMDQYKDLYGFNQTGGGPAGSVPVGGISVESDPSLGLEPWMTDVDMWGGSQNPYMTPFDVSPPPSAPSREWIQKYGGR